MGKEIVAPLTYVEVRPRSRKQLVEIKVGNALGTVEIELTPEQAQKLATHLRRAAREVEGG